MLVDLVRRGFATGCDETHWHGCAQQSISDAATLLPCRIAAGGCQTHWSSCANRPLLCYAELQLDVAKRTVWAARREELGCRSCKRASWEAAQRSSPEKWLLREEVAERRGGSAKRSFSEEVAQQREVAHSSIHPSIN